MKLLYDLRNVAGRKTKIQEFAKYTMGDNCDCPLLSDGKMKYLLFYRKAITLFPNCNFVNLRAMPGTHNSYEFGRGSIFRLKKSKYSHYV